MLANILRCFILLILGVRLIRGSPTPHESQYSLRRTKSEQMLKYMNTSLDPCDDFFEYNCANFAKYYADVLPQMKNIGIMELMRKEMDDKIKLELQADNANDGGAERKVKYFYRSCLKESKLTDAFSNKLQGLIMEFGKMPVMEGDNWRESDWARTVADINYRMHVPIIINLDMDPDMMDSSILRMSIMGPSLPLGDKKIYIDEQFKNNIEQYKHSVANNLQMFLSLEKQLALRTAEEIISFEISLAHGLMDPLTTKPLADIFVLTPTEEVQRKYSPIWDTKKLMTSGLGYLPPQLVVEHSYLENVVAVITNTPKKVLANYIFYTYLSQFMKVFPDTLAEQEEYCLDLTKQYFVKNLDNMMFRKYFTEHDKQSLYVMWDELKSSFKEVLKSPRLSWMQEATRKEAFAKLTTIKFEISAYEEEDFGMLLSTTDIDEFDYIQNIHALLLLQGNEHRARINKPPAAEGNYLVLSGTPIYSPFENAVKIPVYFLQPYRFFSASYPWAFNYAGIGFILAHELIHGFDDTSTNYDANGRTRNWWDPQSTRTLQDRTKCLMNQYTKYTFGGYSLPEMKKQSENIADNGGIRLAYQAYLKWYESASKLNQKIEWFPGMDYSYKQLFFISFGHLWCAATHPSHIPEMLHTDGHVPDKLRVIGPLSNFNEFSKEFNCPRGSGMNPIHKCEIY